MDTLTRTPYRPPAASSSALALRLVFAERADGLPLDRLVPIGPAGLTLGRAPEAAGATLPLPGDGWASRTHARVSPRGEALLVEDLGSRNGTSVDGRRVAGSAPLAPGQVLQVGSALFVCDTLDDDTPPPPAGFAARDAPMRALWQRMVRLADSDVSVLILGELGGGKTHIARLLHDLGPRAGRPFVAHNASALPRNLEEATLFGVVGGFIPTVKAQDGLIARAADGTFFLDELAELPEPAQAKLLDAFDPREPSYLAVGGSRRLPTRCRLITATNRDVFVLARTGALRHDLLSRLAVGQITVPPLRARRSDILPLFQAALARAGAPTLGPARMEEAQALLLARWTENVRGLETLAQRVALGEPLTVGLIQSHADRGATPVASPTPAPPAAAPAAPEAPWPPNRAELLTLLAQHAWEIKAAAEAIGRRRETLSRLVTTLFGGRDAAQEAWRAWQRTGHPPED
ncbi:MAG: sigma 54-interacting transcriptional regulator [Myxococcales bacterium]|nr:sigma 54-interacting transcriptional regulator [Myxococcales bacterium]